jgi:hypothetical protein
MNNKRKMKKKIKRPLDSGKKKNRKLVLRGQSHCPFYV